MLSPALQGVFRSLRTYHGSAAPKAAMDRLYAQFVAPGALVLLSLPSTPVALLLSPKTPLGL